MFLLDTNPIVYYIQGEPSVIKQFHKWRRTGRLFSISIITKIELLSYPKITLDEIQKINSFLKEFRIVILDEIIAEKSAEIRRKYKLLLADSIIAATALFMNATLVTRNIKHFRRIKEIKTKPI